MIRRGDWNKPSSDIRAVSTGLPNRPRRAYDLGLRLARVPSDAASPEAKTLPVGIAPFTATNKPEEVKKYKELREKYPPAKEEKK